MTTRDSADDTRGHGRGFTVASLRRFRSSIYTLSPHGQAHTRRQEKERHFCSCTVNRRLAAKTIDYTFDLASNDALPVFEIVACDISYVIGAREVRTPLPNAVTRVKIPSRSYGVLFRGCAFYCCCSHLLCVLCFSLTVSVLLVPSERERDVRVVFVFEVTKRVLCETTRKNPWRVTHNTHCEYTRSIFLTHIVYRFNSSNTIYYLHRSS